ncbi:MAG: TetR/AcrR family transcriptional regulator [Rhizobiaceae bacterium]|nr:TetR/AcrR family transcriptional regulator [Rhizobiaceae bacterium]
MLPDPPAPHGPAASAAILEAAADLFLKQGFSGTSMDEIADLADVSKQTVYAHFASKEALFAAMADGLTGAAAGAVQLGLGEWTGGASLAEHLTAYAVRQLQVPRTPRLMALRRLAIAEAERFPELGRALHDGGPARAIAGLAEAFSRWHREGLLDAPDAHVAATHFNWLIMAEPVNRAMLLGDAAVPGQNRALGNCAAVRIFLAAYGRGGSARGRGEPS